MPLFSQDKVDAAHPLDASLRAATASEVRLWLANQNDVADAAVRPDAPGTVAVRMADGQLIAVTVSTEHELPPPPAPDTEAHQELAGRIRTWLASERGVGQAWAIRATSAVGVTLVDGTGFIVTVGSCI